MRFQRYSRFESNPVHANRQEHGGGIGSFFSMIFKSLMPLAKKAVGLGSTAIKSKAGQNVIKAAKEIAIDTGKKAIKDVIEGKSVKEAAADNIKAATKRAAKTVKRTAKEAGLEVVQDTLVGKNLKASAKRRIKQASKKLLDEVVEKPAYDSAAESTDYEFSDAERSPTPPAPKKRKKRRTASSSSRRRRPGRPKKKRTGSSTKRRRVVKKRRKKKTKSIMGRKKGRSSRKSRKSKRGGGGETTFKICRTKGSKGRKGKVIRKGKKRKTKGGKKKLLISSIPNIRKQLVRQWL